MYTHIRIYIHFRASLSLCEKSPVPIQKNPVFVLCFRNAVNDVLQRVSACYSLMQHVVVCWYMLQCVIARDIAVCDSV